MYFMWKIYMNSILKFLLSMIHQKTRAYLLLPVSVVILEIFRGASGSGLVLNSLYVCWDRDRGDKIPKEII